MSRRDRCGETHIRDIDSNKLRVRDCVAEIDGELHPMAVHARDGVTSGALAALAESGTSDVLVRVKVGDHYADTVVDVNSLHRRQRSVGASDPDLVKMSLLEEVSGHSINQRAVAVATQRLRATLSPGEIKNFIDEAAPVLAQVVARQPHALDVLRESLGAQEYLDRTLQNPGGSLHPTSDIVFEAPENALVPQAASMESIASAVAAIAAGCRSAGEIAEAIGMVDRQGYYYANAARTLGLAIQDDGWEPTRAGIAFVEADALGRVDYLRSAMSEIDWVTTYVNEGSAALEAQLRADYGYSDVTIDQRKHTFEGWKKFLEAPREEAAKDVSMAMSAAQGLAPLVTERRRSAGAARNLKAARAHAARDKKLDGRRCPRCHVTVAPAVHECENCGTAIG